MAAVTNCENEELLSAYLDGELRAGELELVVDHLAQCGDCRVTFHRLQEARAALRTLPMLDMPETMVPELHLGTSLSAYLDGELATAEVPELMSHLAGCDVCRDELHDLDAARTAVRALPGLEPPAFLTPRARSTPDVGRTRSRKRAAWLAGVAAVAAAAVAVSTSGSPTQHMDLDTFAERHIARVSVDPGFSVVPAVAPLPEGDR